MRKVLLSLRASSKLIKLLEYLESEWSEKVKLEFIKKLDKSLDQIRQYPASTEKSNLRQGLYRCVITKQTTIFYQFNAENIKVITLFDTRMNPKRIRKEIK